MLACRGSCRIQRTLQEGYKASRSVQERSPIRNRNHGKAEGLTYCFSLALPAFLHPRRFRNLAGYTLP